jgi:hypothetical protein
MFFLLVLRQAGVPILAGLGGGLAFLFTLIRFISSLLYGSEPPGPAVISLVALILLTTAALAIARPAARALRIDPMVALRRHQ